MTTKECFKCHRVLPLTDFYVHPRMGDGHLGKCKECTKNDTRNNRAVRVQYYREYDMRRFQAAKRKDRALAYQRKARALNPQKTSCRRLFQYAKSKGNVIVPDTCEMCGKSCKPQGHHTDYSKPFDVMWLCRKCHGKVHGWYKELEMKGAI